MPRSAKKKKADQEKNKSGDGSPDMEVGALESEEACTPSAQEDDEAWIFALESEEDEMPLNEQLAAVMNAVDDEDVQLSLQHDEILDDLDE